MSEFETVKKYGDLPAGRDVIRVSLSRVNGKECKLDIRRYYQNDEGEWCPTKKGIGLNWEQAHFLQELMEKDLFVEWEDFDKKGKKGEKREKSFVDEGKKRKKEAEEEGKKKKKKKKGK